MFNQLVESRSHRAEARRKGRFFLGTLGLYALLTAAIGVAGVYAYDVHLEQAGAEELYVLVMPVPMPPRDHSRPDQPTQQPKTASSGSTRALSMRKDLYANLDSPIPPDRVSTTPANIRTMPNNHFILGDRDYDPPGPIGPLNNSGSLTDDGGSVRVQGAEIIDPPPPAPTPKPTPPQKPVNLTSYLITSKIISKPVPPYPAPAKLIRAQGPVTVEILVDEEGRVISARATSGHSFLRAAAQQAALQARFSPTLLGGKPVKVTGVITYNFIMH